MSHADAPRPGLGVVGLVAGGARLALRGARAMFLPAFLPALVSTAVYRAVLPAPGDPAAALAPSGALLWTGAFDLVLGTFVGGVLCLVAMDAAIGRRHAIGDYVRQAARQFLPLLGIGIVLSVAIGVGAVFLLLPGLYVAARYLPYLPATVFENRGWQGLGRAEALTRGYRWPLVAATLGFGLALAAAYLVVGLPLAALAPRLGLAASAGLEALMTAVGYIAFSAFSAAAYLRLRLLQEGATAAEVAAAVG